MNARIMETKKVTRQEMTIAAVWSLQKGVESTSLAGSLSDSSQTKSSGESSSDVLPHILFGCIQRNRMSVVGSIAFIDSIHALKSFILQSHIKSFSHRSIVNLSSDMSLKVTADSVLILFSENIALRRFDAPLKALVSTSTMSLFSKETA